MMRVLVPVMLLGACSSATMHGTPPADPARTRAALATVIVENRTSHTLDIFYRLAAVPSSPGNVRIGSVPPDTTVRLAPVPAAEPVVFTARRPDGATLTLPPRAVPLDGVWRWSIPVTARFVLPPTP